MLSNSDCYAALVQDAEFIQYWCTSPFLKKWHNPIEAGLEVNYRIYYGTGEIKSCNKKICIFENVLLGHAFN